MIVWLKLLENFNKKYVIYFRSEKFASLYNLNLLFTLIKYYSLQKRCPKYCHSIN